MTVILWSGIRVHSIPNWMRSNARHWMRWSRTLTGCQFFVAALALNAVFLARALKLWRLPQTDKALAKRLYKYSQLYLALLFFAMVIDKIVLA